MNKCLLGTTWGNEGYINMDRSQPNVCGIATAAVFPIIAA